MLNFWKALKGLIQTLRGALIPSKKPSTRESPSVPLTEKVTPPAPPPPRPLEFILRTPLPESVELKFSWPMTIELRHPYPETIELRTSAPISFELRHPMPESFELRHPMPESFELRHPMPESFELRHPMPESVELRHPPSTSVPSESPPNPTSDPFSPGLTTEITDDVARMVSTLPFLTLKPETEALPMAVGMSNGMLTNEVAMSPKKTKTENETVPGPTLGKGPTELPSDVGTGDTTGDLESAASDWSADPIATGHSEESPSPSISLMTDPSGFGSTMSRTHAIAAAQNSDEELPLDLDLADVDSDDADDELAPLNLSDNEAEIEETLARLQAKVAAQDAAAAKDAAELEGAKAAEAKALLAAQIAEDEALERALKEEAEDDLANDPELRAALPREPEETESGELDLREMESCIEALLFMSEKPLSATRLRDLLGPEMSLHYFQEALTNLQARYARFSHGIELAEIAHGYQFRTKPVRAPLAKKLAKIQTQRLSTGAMESLAIIAYKQPVMKDDIDKIRGVDSSHFIRGLLDKKLIKITGRSELPGRPMLYATSSEFLEIFSLKSLDALPPLKELESMIPGSQSGNADDADPRVKKMRELVSQMNSDDSVSLLYDPKEDEKFLTDIRERVKSIEIITPTLQAQADEIEAAKVANKERLKAIAEGRLDPQAESFANAVDETNPGDTAEMPID